MIRRQKDRKDIDYVKPYKNSEHARKDLEGMKDAFRYYKNKKEMLSLLFSYSLDHFIEIFNMFIILFSSFCL